MNTQTASIDMMTELFVDKLQVKPMEHWLPPLSAEALLEQVRKAKGVRDKKDALEDLVLSYRVKTLPANGHYTEPLAKELIGHLNAFVRSIHLGDHAAVLLVREGAYCERVRDYDRAVLFYRASTQMPISDPEMRYFSYNNLGFCLNYQRRFEEAERVLRKAIEFDPQHYNAFKNLGVSLEWQGQYEEAAECYLKAVRISKGQEPRSVLHLKRLLERHPTLKHLPFVMD